MSQSIRICEVAIVVMTMNTMSTGSYDPGNCQEKFSAKMNSEPMTKQN